MQRKLKDNDSITLSIKFSVPDTNYFLILSYVYISKDKLVAIYNLGKSLIAKENKVSNQQKISRKYLQQAEFLNEKIEYYVLYNPNDTALHVHLEKLEDKKFTPVSNNDENIYTITKGMREVYNSDGDLNMEESNHENDEASFSHKHLSIGLIAGVFSYLALNDSRISIACAAMATLSTWLVVNNTLLYGRFFTRKTQQDKNDLDDQKPSLKLRRFNNE